MQTELSNLDRIQRRQLKNSMYSSKLLLLLLLLILLLLQLKNHPTRYGVINDQHIDPRVIVAGTQIPQDAGLTPTPYTNRKFPSQRGSKTQRHPLVRDHSSAMWPLG